MPGRDVQRDARSASAPRERPFAARARARGGGAGNPCRAGGRAGNDPWDGEDARSHCLRPRRARRFAPKARDADVLPVPRGGRLPRVTGRVGCFPTQFTTRPVGPKMALCFQPTPIPVPGRRPILARFAGQSFRFSSRRAARVLSQAPLSARDAPPEPTIPTKVPTYHPYLLSLPYYPTIPTIPTYHPYQGPSAQWATVTPQAAQTVH